MESTNPDNKSLSELIAEAEGKGMKLAIIGDGNEPGKFDAIIKSNLCLAVKLTDLKPEDQQTINKLNEESKPSPFESNGVSDFIERMSTPRHELQTYDVPFIESETKPFYHSLPNRNKKLKGWQRGK